ncbi:hypothetical protein KSF78_0004411, partial [Schistosoma japonicum]
ITFYFLHKPTEDGLLNLIDFNSHNLDKIDDDVALRKFGDIQKLITFLQESCEFAGELTVNNETEALESTTSNLGNAEST